MLLRRSSWTETIILAVAATSLVYFTLLFTSLPSAPTNPSLGVLRHIRSEVNAISSQDGEHAEALSHFAEDEARKQERIRVQSVKTAQIPPGLSPGPDVASDGIDDSVTAVVKCATSAGNLTIDVRAGWAPHGVRQYLDLVDHGLFEDLPFFRVCPKYVTQFGVKHWPDGNPLVASGLNRPIPDDPSLWGRRDMRFGFLFFAGNGENSRSAQMVVALCPTVELCRSTGLGRAYWEVPVGTIRKDGFAALGRIGDSGKPYPRLEMIGQDPHAGGPNQARIVTEPDYLHQHFPFMQYWRGCSIVHRDIRLSRPLNLDAVGGDEDGNVPADESKPFRVLVSVYTPKTASGASCEHDIECLKGQIELEIDPMKAPIGAKRFRALVKSGYFNGARFFRAIRNFMVQFGIAADPIVTQKWRDRAIIDDKVTFSNKRGTISFATSGPNSRSTQLFINVADNAYLDKEGFAPIGRVVRGMEVVDAINFEYGEGGKGDGSDGRGPSQGRINKEGNAYLLRYFPRLSYISSAELL